MSFSDEIVFINENTNPDTDQLIEPIDDEVILEGLKNEKPVRATKVHERRGVPKESTVVVAPLDACKEFQQKESRKSCIFHIK